MMNYEKYKKFYYNNDFNNINMSLKIFQKYYIRCLIETNKISNYSEAKIIFKKQFIDIDLILTEDTIKKLISDFKGTTKNLQIEELLNTLKINNNDVIIDIYPIKTKKTDKNNRFEEREQNAILISSKTMIKILDEKNAKMYGLDFTYKLIPKSYTPYKLMTLYGIDNNKNSIVIGCLICLKYTDSESLNKLFGILNINYNFNPQCISTDFSKSQIKAIKECKYFKNKIYIVPCLFHFAQAIIKKFKELKIIKKYLNKRGYELLRNLEILCFIKFSKIDEYIKYLKINVFINENEKEFMNYFVNTWIKKYKKIFNYHFLIEDILSLKKNIYLRKEIRIVKII